MPSSPERPDPHRGTYGSSDDEGSDLEPVVLEARDLASVARYMQSDQCKKVFVMAGAGLSVAAGIPDFRSPDTGLYANLGKYNLPFAEAIFEVDYFRSNPAAFYAFAKEFDPSVYRPTLAHSFIKLLDTKGLLHTCFTQNIDGLESRAHIPEEKLIEAHGTITTQRCIDCRRPCDGEAMWAKIKAGEVMYCEDCGSPVKPDIVFFGEALPVRFLKAIATLQEADLLIILGTSLTVHPFATLTKEVSSSCPRVLMNLTPAGDICSYGDDVVCLGKCDDTVRELARLLGWEADLDAEWAKTALPTAAVSNGNESGGKPTDKTAEAEDAVSRLAEEIAGALNLTDKPKGEASAETSADEPALVQKREDVAGYKKSDNQGLDSARKDGSEQDGKL